MRTYEAQRLQAEAERAAGVVAELTVRRSELHAESLKATYDIQVERLNQLGATVEAQIAAQRARLARDQNAYDRMREQVEALSVRAGLAGVVQTVLIEEGAQVQPGANIARVAQPDELMAELRVPETQVRDVVIGQLVAVDTRNGIVDGKVIRIDPAVVEGTVQVDVELTGKLPRGARPDQSVDGTIEIDAAPGRRQDGPVHVLPAELDGHAVQARRRGRVRHSRARPDRRHVGQRGRDRAKAWCPATRSSSPTPRRGTTWTASG